MEDLRFFRLKINKEIRGEALQKFLLEGIERNQQDIIDVLSEYEPNSLFYFWKEFLRCAEEVINYKYCLGNDLKKVFLTSIKKQDVLTNSLVDACEILSNNFDLDVSKRFVWLINFIAEYNTIHEPSPKYPLSFIKNVGQVVSYLQSRRYHYHSLLHLIILYAKGKKLVEPQNIFTTFHDLIDLKMMSNVTAFQRIVQSKSTKKLVGTFTTDGRLAFGDSFSQLEGFFINPVRLSILDLLKFNIVNSPEPQQIYNAICSKLELRDMIYSEGISWEAFGLQDNNIYKSLRSLINDLLDYFNGEYFIEIDNVNFQKICISHKELCLYKEDHDFADAISSHAPFLQYGNIYLSNNFAILRYAECEINNILNNIRKFQIQAGFVFEEKVTAIVEKYGFIRDRSVKRIQRKEFDVVCVKGDCIYNFQCKNNYINVEDFNLFNIKKACSVNKRIEKYYQRALQKEISREQLLINRIEIRNIKHYVVSRYPVFTDNLNIINYNQLEQFVSTLK